MGLQSWTAGWKKQEAKKGCSLRGMIRRILLSMPVIWERRDSSFLKHTIRRKEWDWIKRTGWMPLLKSVILPCPDSVWTAVSA